MPANVNIATTELCACGYALVGTEAGRCPECGRNITADGLTPVASYREHRIGQHRNMTVYPDRVAILTQKWFSNSSWVSVPLDGLSLVTTTVWLRSSTFQKASRLCSRLLLTCAVAVVFQLMNRVSLFWLLIPVTIGLPPLLLLLATSRPTEFVRFHLREAPGHVKLDVGRLGPDNSQFDDFVAAIKKSIEANRRKEGDWVYLKNHLAT
jgi:hypothetical protein